MKRFFTVVPIAAILGAMAFVGCQKANKPPETPAVPSGASVGEMDTTYDFTSSADDPDDDSVAIRFDWGDGDTSAWSASKASGDSIAASHSWSDSGTYSVKAQAKDEDDATSDWSAGREIEISSGGGNEPPNTPSEPAGPDTGRIGIEYDFASAATDPDGDSVAIRFDWGDGDTSDWSAYVQSGDTVTTGHSWADTGTYLVGAQAKDKANATSGWPFVYIRISAETTPSWPMTYGGPADDVGESVWPCTDGGYMITGYTSSYGSGTPNVYVVKTDALGNRQWDRWLGYGNTDYGYSGQQTTDGGYIVAGSTKNSSVDWDVYLAKLSASGATVWEMPIGRGDEVDAAYSVQQTRDGGYILLGYNEPWLGDQEMYLLKRFSDGSEQWTHRKGYDDSDDRGISVQQTADDGYILVGTTDHVGDDIDVYIKKTGSDGVTQWYRIYWPGAGQGTDQGRSVRQTSDGGYIIAGSSNSSGNNGGYDVYLIKIDGAGNRQWERTLGGQYDDEGWSVTITLDGGYMIAGYTKSFGAQGKDVYVIKTNSVGDTVWTRKYDRPGDDAALSIERQYDSYIIAGYTTTASNGQDVYLLKIDGDGDLAK